MFLVPAYSWQDACSRYEFVAQMFDKEFLSQFPFQPLYLWLASAIVVENCIVQWLVVFVQGDEGWEDNADRHSL